MPDVTHYSPENDAVDWHALADQLFPAEALRTTPAVNPPGLSRNVLWPSAN
jgi:hypothetical protein